MIKYLKCVYNEFECNFYFWRRCFVTEEFDFIFGDTKAHLFWEILTENGEMQYNLEEFLVRNGS